MRSMILLALAVSAQAHAALPDDFVGLAARCAPDVHPATLAAIVQTESGGNPYAIGVNKGQRLKRQPRSAVEALAVAHKLLAAGANIDFGWGQINVKNLAWLGLSVVDVFDPCRNLEAAGRVLGECYGRAVRKQGEGQGALRSALSCYNTGSLVRGRSNGYVARVVTVALKVPAIEPTPGDSQPPVLVRRVKVSQPAAEPEQGQPDAFSGRMDDAFSAPLGEGY